MFSSFCAYQQKLERSSVCKGPNGVDLTPCYRLVSYDIVGVEERLAPQECHNCCDNTLPCSEVDESLQLFELVEASDGIFETSV